MGRHVTNTNHENTSKSHARIQPETRPPPKPDGPAVSQPEPVVQPAADDAEPEPSATAQIEVKLALCYTAVVHGPRTADYASRFVATWREYPPGAEHDTFALCNGGMLPRETGLIFAPLSLRFVVRSNSGWDIGGYVEAAKGPCADYDLMLCCGESVYFHRAGWLKRLLDAHAQHGEGVYGFFGSYVIRPHLQTTCFAASPRLLREYPHAVDSRESRYEFEHGKRSFWKWATGQGKPALLVTWDGCYPVRQWRAAPNILWRGDQSNCLMWTNHTDRYAKANNATRRQWARNADVLRDWGMAIAPIAR